MTTENRPRTTEAVAVLAQMYVLLWQASAEAADAASTTRDVAAVDLANDLTYACDQVFNLIPTAYHPLLLAPPPLGEEDPLRLARYAEQLARSVPEAAWPSGLAPVVQLLGDTLKGVS